MANELPFLDDKAMSETAEQPEAPAPEVAAVEPEAPGETVAAPPAASVEETQRHVPITALLDERDKRQAIAREAEELRKKLAEIEAQKTAPKQPDFYEDPEGFLRTQQARVQQAVVNERLNMSELLAREKHGDAVVDEATEAFKAAATGNPALAQQLVQNANPFAFVVNWHKQQKTLSAMGSDPEAWIAQQVEARLQERLAAMGGAPSVQPKPTAPPPSLASAAAAGGTSSPPVSGFNQLFGR